MRRLILGGTILVVAVAARVWTAQADEPSFDPSIDAHGVGVRAGGCSLVDDLGSGVIMGNGVVLTSAHVVAGATDVRVVIDGREIPARVDAFDPDADLAVLQAQVTGPPTPIVRAPLDADVVIVAWTPDRGVETHATTLARRLLVTIEDIYIDSVVEREAIELARGVERGTSGAGVFDREGQLVGIVYGSSKERSASFALDAPVLERLIEESDGEPSPHGRCI
ncbi:MAG: trypsin-like peptidase domain-containing protein [Actinomycetia bacterium]|nr:trypsin-like peptidase domain-containing protein [Actinomycetes bacterium]